jgi:AcrR family transcriptional regulator
VLSCQGELSEALTTPSETTARRRRSDGERSRAAILDAATQLATVEGLDGLSIGRLAEHTGMSKSGLYAHFGSKEELQLAMVAAAQEIFLREVIEPARQAQGIARVEALAHSFLSYIQRHVFPGGCFFRAAQAEFAAHPGPVQDKVREAHALWLGYLERQVRGAQEMGEIDETEDPAQLAFELYAMLETADAVFQLNDDPQALERGRRGIGARLARAKIGG